MENLLPNLPQFGQELLLTSGLASYLAALLNQPSWPRPVKLIIVLGVAIIVSGVQEYLHPTAGVDFSARVMAVFAAALLLYNNLLKGLGGDWLTNSVTAESIKAVYVALFPAKTASRYPLSETATRLKALEALKDALPADAYEAKLQEILKEV